MLWAILAPVGALMFHGIRESTGWFVAYLTLLVFSAVVDVPLTSTAAQIPEPAIAAFFAANVIMVSTILFLVLRHFVSETETAKKQSDVLLTHMLPTWITERLKEGESPIADRVEMVSVVFADIVDFTPLSESLEPEDLVELLNSLYAAFDGIADSLQLEKIRTVGDSYIAVAGLPDGRSDHALAAVQMASLMRDRVHMNNKESGWQPIEMRFGIHSGPVVAAVIGTQKLNYEVWGDTVNIASRMESSGFPDKIQVSDVVYQQVKDTYELTHCGLAEIKGKGPMNTYILGEIRQTTNQTTLRNRTQRT